MGGTWRGGWPVHGVRLPPRRSPAAPSSGEMRLRPGPICMPWRAGSRAGGDQRARRGRELVRRGRAAALGTTARGLPTRRGGRPFPGPEARRAGGSQGHPRAWSRWRSSVGLQRRGGARRVRVYVCMSARVLCASAEVEATVPADLGTSRYSCLSCRCSRQVCPAQHRASENGHPIPTGPGPGERTRPCDLCPLTLTGRTLCGLTCCGEVRH